MRFFFLLLLALSIMSGCQQNVENNQTNGGIQNLSTEEQKADKTGEAENNLNNESMLNEIPKEEQQHQDENNEEELDLQQGKNTNDDLELQQEEDNDPKLELKQEKELTETDQVEVSATIQMPFKDFKERWNAISKRDTAQHYISTFDSFLKEEDPFYRTFLDNQLELKVFVTEDQHIEKVHVISRNQAKTGQFSMVTSWWQVLLITNPTVETHDIDSLFSKIGVGPNADVSNVGNKSFTYGGIKYNIVPTENGYLFEAIYT